jgi:hypothetical protein
MARVYYFGDPRLRPEFDNTQSSKWINNFLSAKDFSCKRSPRKKSMLPDEDAEGEDIEESNVEVFDELDEE